MRKMMIAAAAALATVSTAALAIVTFDYGSGTGFVGKGDVQLKYGWNDQALQSKAGGVSFFVAKQEEYKFDCTFTVEVGREKVREPRTQNRGSTVAVNSSISFETRKNAQSKITGFTLIGLGAETSSDGAVPVEGGRCPGGQFNDGVISDVELNSSEGGLFVKHTEGTYLLTIS